MRPGTDGAADRSTTRDDSGGGERAGSPRNGCGDGRGVPGGRPGGHGGHGGHGRQTLGAGHFDGLYAASPDPYGLASRWYEHRKYAITVAMLPAARYRSAFEPGCSIGVLTAMLAPRCGRLLSCDLSAAAVRAAARRAEEFPQVQVERRAVPADWPPGRFDLIVFSEMLYYLSGADLGLALDRAVTALLPGGTLLSAHWRRRAARHPQTGDGVQEAITGRPELALIADHREPDFIAQAHLRVPPGTDPASVSVAAAEGLVQAHQ